MAKKTKPEDFKSIHDIFDFKKLREYFKNNEDVKETARGLEVTLDEYVDYIMQKMEDPSKEPEYEWLSDEEMLARDPDFVLNENNIMAALQALEDGTVPMVPQVNQESTFDAGGGQSFEKIGGSAAPNAPTEEGTGQVTAKDKEIADALKGALDANRIKKT